MLLTEIVVAERDRLDGKTGSEVLHVELAARSQETARVAIPFKPAAELVVLAVVAALASPEERVVLVGIPDRGLSEREVRLGLGRLKACGGEGKDQEGRKLSQARVARSHFEVLLEKRPKLYGIVRE